MIILGILLFSTAGCRWDRSGYTGRDRRNRRMARTTPKQDQNSNADAAAGRAIADLLHDLRARVGPIKTGRLSELIHAQPDLARPIPKTTIDKWFASPTGSAFRPPPRDRPDIGNALIVVFKDLKAWEGKLPLDQPQREAAQIRSYFEPPATPSAGIDTETGAIAREIERRRDPVVTAAALFTEALKLKPAILCVIPEAMLAAADNPDLRRETIDFVKKGGCYAIIVPGGKPPWPSDESHDDDGLHELVSEWRKIHSSAWNLVQDIRRKTREGEGVHDRDNAEKRVHLVEPTFTPEQRSEHFRLIRLLPPTMGPAIRPWLLFAGTDPLEDAMAYTCGSIESTDGQVWTRLSMVAPRIASSLGISRADVSHFTRPRHDQEALKRYCWDVLRAWRDNDGQHLGISCDGVWKYHSSSAQGNE